MQVCASVCIARQLRMLMPLMPLMPLVVVLWCVKSSAY